MSSGEGKGKRRAESHTEAWDGRQRERHIQRGIPRGISAQTEPLTLLHQCQEVTGWGGRKPSGMIRFMGLVSVAVEMGQFWGPFARKQGKNTW
jgi:hypothetical protein